jgi:hypothetical protein
MWLLRALQRALACQIATFLVLLLKCYADNRLAMEISMHACRSERGPNSYSHEWTLNRLNGKKIMLIGDSVTRYQYLEFAYYVVYGKCPEQDKDYVISEEWYDGWDDFFTKTSTVLSVDSPPIRTQETCLCAREELIPGRVSETRVFTYVDKQVMCHAHQIVDGEVTMNMIASGG